MFIFELFNIILFANAIVNVEIVNFYEGQLKVLERNWNELLIFSRRTQEQLNSWARRYGYKDQPKEMLEHTKKGYDGRYTCVNLTNYSTIEFRIFRGTLKLNTILATLQLVNHICEVAVSLSDEEVRHLSWSRFVDQITEPELIQYLKERRIYVNESISNALFGNT